MADKKDNVRVVLDWKTGAVYALVMDSDDKVKGVQAVTDGPLFSKNNGQPPMPPAGGQEKDMFPYGQTTYGIEPTGEGEYTVFTMIWPDKSEMDNGKFPEVAMKTLPQNLIDAGIANLPETLKSEGQRALESEEGLKEALSTIMDLVGLDNVKKDLKQNIAMARFARAKREVFGKKAKISAPSLHLVFTGNPGTGKTTVAREYAKVLHSLGFIKKPKVTEVQRTDLVAGYVGQTAIKTREVIEKAKGGVLFIDEAYALTLGNSDKDFGKESIAELVAAMENNREDLVVIVAGYPEPMKTFIEANEGLKSRFLNYMNFEDYNLSELSKMLDFMLEQRGYAMDADARAKAVEHIGEEMNRSKKHFGNGRTVRNLIDKAEKNLAFRLDKQSVFLPETKLDKEEKKKLLTTFTLSDIDAVDLSGIDNKKSGGMGFDVEKSNDNISPDAATVADQKKPTSAQATIKGKAYKPNKFGF